MDLEERINTRAKEILDGFDRIFDLVKDFLPNGTLMGTVTGLSALPLEGRDPRKALEKRLSKEVEVKFVAFSFGVHKRFELSKNGPLFHLTPSMSPGYAGVFLARGDPEAISRKLAHVELISPGPDRWFGWVWINHPIHYVDVLLGDEEVSS